MRVIIAVHLLFYQSIILVFLKVQFLALFNLPNLIRSYLVLFAVVNFLVVIQLPFRDPASMSHEFSGNNNSISNLFKTKMNISKT